jgi:hypothetical protein
MPTARIYEIAARRLQPLFTLRGLAWMTPVILILGALDNTWGKQTFHVTGRILTTFLILWVPATLVAALFRPRVTASAESIRPSIARLRIKTALCSAVLLMALAFLWLVHAQDWSEY